ncbi:MAG: proton-conducting transporter membrane subunit [Candidatus Omnitrophota bacterium]
MVSILLIIIPFLLGLVCFFTRNDFFRRGLIVFGAGIHFSLTCLAWVKQTSAFSGEWFAFDNISILFLTITSVLFLGGAVYCVQYLSDESRQHENVKNKRKRFTNEAVFSGCFLLFLSTMTLVIASQHLAVLWVGIEATTLASAPLIYFHRTKRSLEATWKYLLICSVGIAIALLGIFFLAVANNNQQELFLIKMIGNAGQINTPWLKASFLLLFVGYGTKMGLAPFHTWLPDAHSEAPSVVSALLSGALLNCAFLGILRVYQICIAAGLQAYCQEIFIVFGLLSVLFAAVFILGQTDYKRMLAYSSVEHMGIITLGLGLGGGAVLGSMINMLGHSLTKAGLFFIAGNILSYFRTKKISDIHGLIAEKMRRSGVFWLVGFLLITGTPPSGIFLGKFIILKEALLQGHYWITFIFLAALAIVFIGMARIFILMTQGKVSTEDDSKHDLYNGDSVWRTLVPGLFFVLVICIGIYLPAWLSRALEAAAKGLGGL